MIDPKAHNGTYSFNWTAATPIVGCSSSAGPNPPLTGTVTGSVNAAYGHPLDISAQLNEVLPVGTEVTYTLSFNTTVAGFPTSVTSNSESYSTGEVPDDGTPYADVQGATSAVAYAYLPQFPEPYAGWDPNAGDAGTTPQGGMEIVGGDGWEYGLFGTATPSATLNWSYVGGTPLSVSCGTLLTQNLTGLSANTVYDLGSVHTIGIGTCPARSPPSGMALFSSRSTATLTSSMESRENRLRRPSTSAGLIRRLPFRAISKAEAITVRETVTTGGTSCRRSGQPGSDHSWARTGRRS